MTKKEATEILAKYWKELTSDIPREDKVKILTNISLFLENLIFEEMPKKDMIDPCNIVLQNFAQVLEIDPKYKDPIKPSDFCYFALAVENSNLL